MAYDVEAKLLTGFKAALNTVAWSPTPVVRRWRLSYTPEDYPCVYVHVATAVGENDPGRLSGQLVSQVTFGVETDISSDPDGADCDTLFGQLRGALATPSFMATVTAAMTGVGIYGMLATGTGDENGDQEADVYGRSITFSVSTQ